MKLHVLSSVLSVLPALIPLAAAAPAPAPPRSSNPPLKGSKGLIGYSPTNSIATGTHSVKYSLLPAQTEDPKIGSYLDFEKVADPQPIRGSTGSDDPGPRK